MNAKIVVDLGFGDSGKGRTVDDLCSQAHNPLVIRYCGGQQAGHTVMIGNMKHVHSNFGAGTLRGVPAYFTEHCSIYLNTLVREKELLQSKGVVPELTVHPLTKITTPYDVAWNRLTEKKNNHGSCGLGVAATMKRHNETGHKLFAIDFQNKNVLLQKLTNISLYYDRKVKDEGFDIGRFWSLVEIEGKTFRNNLEEKHFEVLGYDYLAMYDNLIFEGSQGIMLDMDHGIFPNVTYANTTSKNALEICKNLHLKYPQIYYVTRCYQTRHGNGWMSNDRPIELINNEEEINVTNQWQGNFRIGELDYDLLNYALSVDEIYSKDHIKNLVVTCLDQRPEFKFDKKQLQTNFRDVIEFRSPINKCLNHLV